MKSPKPLNCEMDAQNVCRIPGTVLWKDILPYFPFDHLLNDDGVFFEKITNSDTVRDFISGPCWISALTRSSQGTEWGCQVHWIDQDGNERSMAFPARKLSEPRAPLAGDLASLGLKIVPGKERRLMAYLGSFRLPSSFRIQSSSQLGWATGNNDAPLFVLPDRAISQDSNEKVVFQPEEHTPSTRNLQMHGSIKQWQCFVAKPCKGNPSLIFGICVAFAAPLLKFAGLDSGGFHFYGTSSKGKTTTLQAATSVWGCGADPSVSENSCINRWNTTGNAIEAVAAAHNDLLLTLDEIGTCDAKNFGKVIYDLFGGRGKSRLQKNSVLQPERSWRILGLSSGEISVQQKVEEDSGRRAMTGQLIRMVDIPIKTNGVIENSHGKNTKIFIDDFKKKCGEYYGTAGPLFIERIVALEPDVLRLRQRILDEVNGWEINLSEGKSDLETYQQRVIRRFALVSAAGALAIQFGILPLNTEDIRKSVLDMRDNWLGDDENKSSSAKGVEAIKEFILRNPGRFPSGYYETGNAKDLAGFYTTAEGGLYLFTKDGFREACAGFPREGILDELERLKHLHAPEKGRKMFKYQVDGIGRNRFYAVKKSLVHVPE